VHAPADPSQDPAGFTPDSGRAWVRLGLVLLIASIGAVGMWSVVVALPVVQAEFAATRGAISLAFTMTMMGFGLGGVVMAGSPTVSASSRRWPQASASSGFRISQPDFRQLVAVHRDLLPDGPRHLGDLWRL